MNKLKRGSVVKVWGYLVGIIQNPTRDFSGQITGYRITVDPVDPTTLYATPGPRCWITVPAQAVEYLGR